MRSLARMDALALLGAAMAIGLVKEGRRRWRYRGTIRAGSRPLRAPSWPSASSTRGQAAAWRLARRRHAGLRRFGLTGATFARATARARYGPLGAPVAAAESRRELRPLVRALRRSLPLHRRIRGYLLARSLRGVLTVRVESRRRRERDLRPLPAGQAAPPARRGRTGEPCARAGQGARAAEGVDPRGPRDRLFRSRRWQEAEAEFRALIELAPADHYGHFGLGRSLEKQGRKDEAAGHLKLAGLLRPSDEPLT